MSNDPRGLTTTFYTLQGRLQIAIGFSADHSTHTVEQILADDGKMIKASSVAAPWKKGFIVGTILDKAVWCQLMIAE